MGLAIGENAVKEHSVFIKIKLVQTGTNVTFQDKEYMHEVARI